MVNMFLEWLGQFVILSNNHFPWVRSTGYGSVLVHTLADLCADPAQFVAQNTKCLTENNITYTVPKSVSVTADNVVETLTTVLTRADPATMCSNIDAWSKALECVVTLEGQCPGKGGGTSLSGQKLDELKKIQQEACFNLKQSGSVMIVPTGRHIYTERGGTVRLACAGVGLGDGTDVPVYQWSDAHQNDINGTQGRVHVIDMGTSSILVISNVQGSDEDTYFCTGSSTKTKHATAYTAVRVYDAFYVPDINCYYYLTNIKPAFDECAQYYNITGLTFPKVVSLPDYVTNNADVFFTQDIANMCSNPSPYNQAARCVSAASYKCLATNDLLHLVDYLHTGNDVVEGMEAICSAYAAGSYNASCVNYAKHDLPQCNVMENTNPSTVDFAHGWGKALMCRTYGSALDCAEKYLQVCTPKMHTVEAYKVAYRAMEPSRCSTDDGQPGAVTDSRVCFHSADLHAQYRQCFLQGNYNITLPTLISEMEMAYTIPALVVLQTTTDTCSNTAPLKTAYQCVRDISKTCLYHNWYNLMYRIPYQIDVEAALRYKCGHIADYDDTCVEQNSAKVFQCAWQKMANEFNLVYQRNMQAMFCRMRGHIDECVQSALSTCSASSRKTFLSINNLLSPTQNGCAKFFSSVPVHTLADLCADPAHFVAQNTKCLTGNNITYTVPKSVSVTADNVVETLTTLLTRADPAAMCSNIDAWSKALECVVTLDGQCPFTGGGTSLSGQKLDELKKIQQEACFNLKQSGSVMIVPTGRHIYTERGGTVRLACAGVGLGDGTDVPVYQWSDAHRNDINGTQGRVHVIDMGTSSILVISNVQGSDEDTYFCTGSSTKTKHATAYTAVRVYDAFYVPDINCNYYPTNIKPAFDECAHYYNITGLTFPKVVSLPDYVTNNADVFFTQDIANMCSNPSPYNQAARCVSAASYKCLATNALPHLVDYLHTGNDVVEGMEAICSAYAAGSYNASCVNSAKDDLPQCNVMEYTHLSKVDFAHGWAKAMMCRMYGFALDCAEKYLQVCTPKMHTVEAYKVAYRAMRPSQCATDDGQPGAVTDSRVCFHSADLHAQYRQCFLQGNYNITLPTFISEMEMAYTIPALVVLQTTPDSCSNTAPLKTAYQCVRDISKTCLYHNWYNLMYRIPYQLDVEAALQYKCGHIADYDATCVAQNSAKVFQCAWQKMANEFNLVYQRNMQAMFCGMRGHIGECVQSALSTCSASSRKTFLSINNLLSPTQNGCAKFGHAVAVSNIIG